MNESLLDEMLEVLETMKANVLLIKEISDRYPEQEWKEFAEKPENKSKISKIEELCDELDILMGV